MRSKENVLDLRTHLSEAPHIKLISKIENLEGVQNFDDILRVRYAIKIIVVMQIRWFAQQ